MLLLAHLRDVLLLFLELAMMEIVWRCELSFDFDVEMAVVISRGWQVGSS